MKTILIIGGLGAALAVAALVGAASLWLFDTQYAPGYSESAFRSLNPGDPARRATNLLGAPLFTRNCEPYVLWIYSQDKQPRFQKTGIGSGTYTLVTFTEGTVKSVFGQTQVSRSTVTLGNGAGFLALTADEVEKLKGSTPGEIQKRFGPPRAVYEYKACKELWYSRSPSSSDYHLRMLGLDDEGKIVHIGRSIYWD